MPARHQILLIGGPLDGVVHELDPVAAGWAALPAQIGIHDDADPSVMHWYNVDDSPGEPTAKFLCTGLR